MDSVDEVQRLQALELRWQGSPSTSNELTFSSTTNKRTSTKERTKSSHLRANETLGISTILGGAAVLGGAAYALDSQYRLGLDSKFIYRMAAAGGHIVTQKGTNFTVCDNWDRTLNRLADKNKPCFISADDETIFTFAQVDQMSNQIARWAVASGMKKRDVCGLFMENKPEYVTTWLGLNKAGVTVALINSNNKMGPLMHSLKVGNCKALIFGTELTQAVDGVMDQLREMNMPLFSVGSSPPAYAPDIFSTLDVYSDAFCNKEEFRAGMTDDDVFGYIYTSGTTGLPKACVMRNNKMMMAAALPYYYGVTGNDVLYTVLPLYHSAGGMLGVGCVVNYGCTMVLTKKFSASRFWKDCYTYKATATQYIGELARYLLNSPESEYDTKHSVRVAFGNGMRKEAWIPFQKRFRVPEIGEFYGATEGNVSFANHAVTTDFVNFPGASAMGQTGALMKWAMGWQVVKHDVAAEEPIRDPKTGFCIPCKPGEDGELLGLMSESGPLKYEGYTDEESTNKKILADVMKKGDKYFRTGDLIRYEPDGYLYFVDRIGDTFRWKGENVSTNEVGAVVSEFPGVEEANIYGVTVPGNEDGRACMAALVMKDGEELDAAALLEHMDRSLASYARPLFLRELPQMESTGTFKQRKVDFVKQGIDPTQVNGDRLWFYDSNTKSFTLLDAPAYQKIAQGTARL